MMGREAIANEEMLRNSMSEEEYDELAMPPNAEVPKEHALWPALDKAIREVYDPEIPVNIAELGLIYDCRPYELEDGQWRVEIKMTLTAPGCGMGPSIADEVKSKIESIPGVAEAKVDLVWEPPWNMEMMSEEARLHLGMM